MKKTAVLFSGQGSQYTGMGVELVEAFPKLSTIYQCASDIVGFDVFEKCKSATAEELAQTQIAQPCIMATSLVAYGAVQQIGINADAVGGHSLGEYSAMVSSGIVTMEQGFEIIKHRAIAMSEHTKGQDGAMCAVMGCETDELEQLCNEIDGYVVPVNYNSPSQTVIAGESVAIQTAIEKLEAMGKKAVKLAVSSAFHSKLMQPSADYFYSQIKDISFNAPKIDYYSNVTGEKLDLSAYNNSMAEYLIAHLVSPVQFVKELNNMQAVGIERFIECGPNKVVSGLVKRTLKGCDIYNVENNKTIEKLRG